MKLVDMLGGRYIDSSCTYIISRYFILPAFVRVISEFSNDEQNYECIPYRLKVVGL